VTHTDNINGLNLNRPPSWHYVQSGVSSICKKNILSCCRHDL